MSSWKVKPGQNVEVILKGKVTTASDKGFYFREAKVGRMYWFSHDADGVGMELKVCEPANWPVKLGDIWETENGVQYVAIGEPEDSFTYTTLLVQVDSCNYRISKADLKKLNPVLKYRRNDV